MHSSSDSVGTAGGFPDVMRPRRVGDLSQRASADVNEWNYIWFPQYPINGRLGGLRGWSRDFGRKKNVFQNIKPLFSSYPAPQLVDYSDYGRDSQMRVATETFLNNLASRFLYWPVYTHSVKEWNLVDVERLCLDVIPIVFFWILYCNSATICSVLSRHRCVCDAVPMWVTVLCFGLQTIWEVQDKGHKL